MAVSQLVFSVSKRGGWVGGVPVAVTFTIALPEQQQFIITEHSVS